MSSFTQSDFDKHNGKYILGVMNDILSGKAIKLGAKGTSQQVLDKNSSAMTALKANEVHLNNTNFLQKFKPNFTGRKPKYFFDDNEKISWTQIFKGAYSNTNTSKLSTKEQEDISAEILNQIVNKNVHEFSPNIVYKLAPTASDDWISSFEYQFNSFLEIKNRYSLKKGYEVDRDGDFMQFITKISKNHGFDKKDAWNPSDIWLIKKTSKNKLKKSLENATNIDEVNMMMRQFFKERTLIGISLKKLNKQSSIYELNAEIFIMDTSNIEIREIQCPLNIEFDKSSSKMKLASKEFTFRYNYKNLPIKGQYRVFDKKEELPAQIELSVEGSAAKLGKVGKELRDFVLHKYSGEQNSPVKNTPLTFEEFKNSKFAKQLKVLMNDRIGNMCRFNTSSSNNVNSYEDALNNFEELYKNGKEFIKTDINAKLQAIQMAYIFNAAFNKDKLNNLLKELYYASKKIGEKMGPYVLIADY